MKWLAADCIWDLISTLYTTECTLKSDNELLLFTKTHHIFLVWLGRNGQSRTKSTLKIFYQTFSYKNGFTRCRIVYPDYFIYSGLDFINASLA